MYRKTVDPNNPLNLPGPKNWNDVKKHEISDPTHRWYAKARGATSLDPLAIDLDGDGIETVGAEAGVLFDHDGDGLKTGSGWVKGDDAWVVLDKNGNGTIDSGAELFGIDYVCADGKTALEGFDAIADLDSNADGVFDAADSQYANVRLWRDMIQDGIRQAGELQSLAAAGIASRAVALELANNPFYRKFPDHRDISAMATFPDMRGSGPCVQQ